MRMNDNIFDVFVFKNFFQGELAGSFLRERAVRQQLERARFGESPDWDRPLRTLDKRGRCAYVPTASGNPRRCFRR
jgi:hypothetical protein